MSRFTHATDSSVGASEEQREMQEREQAPSLDISAIEARARAATPGPYEYDNDDGYGRDNVYVRSRGLIAQGVGDSAEAEDTMKHFAGLSPEVVLALCARYRRMEEALRMIADGKITIGFAAHLAKQALGADR